MTMLQILTQALKKEITPEEASKQFRPPDIYLSVSEENNKAHGVGLWIDEAVKNEQEGCVIIMNILDHSIMLMDKTQIIPLNTIKEIYEKFIMKKDTAIKSNIITVNPGSNLIN